MRETRRWILGQLTDAFSALFPGRSLRVEVDKAKECVTVFGEQSGMEFVRPEDPSFKNLTLPFAALSDGELNSLFLLFEILYHSHEANRRTLFLIDEIENHLHPELQSRFVGLLEDKIPENSMVLATTHSPVIVAAAAPASRILMVHSSHKDPKGNLYANQLLTIDSRTPITRMLYELYGAQSSALATSLLSHVHDVAASEVVPYAQQCLLESDVKDASRPSDPQRTWLAGFIHNLRSSQSTISILDVGAGTGKAIRSLREDFSSGTLASAIALDLVEPIEQRRERLRGLRQTGAKILVRDIYESIHEVPRSKCYHMIFAHNVLHELPPEDVVALLELTCSQLSEDCALSVLEQSLLPRGELGYFVFHATALVELLRTLRFSVSISQRPSYSGIPLYEITAHSRDATSEPDLAFMCHSVIEGINRTITLNTQQYSEAIRKRADPTELAFLAFNIANGLLRARTLCLRSFRGQGIDTSP